MSITCRAAYVGCNTWDLMDKSRDLGARPEVQSRLDAMKTGGWSVGRTWGFSLGTGLVNSPVGQVVSDPTKILETAPGVHQSAQSPTVSQGRLLRCKPVNKPRHTAHQHLHSILHTLTHTVCQLL